MKLKNNSITIPEKLQKTLNTLANDSGFESLEEFINHILNEIVSSAYSGMEKELVDNEKSKERLIELIKNNPGAKEYYVALYSHYIAIGDFSNAGDIQLQIINRFY